MQLGKKSALPKRRSLLATRRGNVIIAVSLAVFSVILLIIFLHNYKKSLTDTSLRKVLVADRLIPKGASANVLVQGDKSLKIIQVRQNQLKGGAIPNASSLKGEVATRDIFPGEQIVGSDFDHSTQPLLTDVQGANRAVSIAVDASHGLVGQVKSGDFVDVMVSFNGQSGLGATQPFTRLLMRDVLVLDAPSAPKKGLAATTGSTSDQDVVLRVPAKKMSDLAFAADNGKVWLALRPTSGAVDPQVDKATLSRLLATTAPVQIGTVTVSQPGHKPVKVTVKAGGGH